MTSSRRQFTCSCHTDNNHSISTDCTDPSSQTMPDFLRDIMDSSSFTTPLAPSAPPLDEAATHGNRSSHSISAEDNSSPAERDNSKLSSVATLQTSLIRHSEGSDENMRDKKTNNNNKSKRKSIRVLCCLGWIFCCPLWTIGWAGLTSPQDKEDLKEDPCYPCYS